MNHMHNPKLTRNAQNLRRAMTKEERHLWYDFLKDLPVTINRQKVIDHYIVDFYCGSAHLAIELDGSQHYEEEAITADKERDQALNKLGISVVRYSNDEINRNFDAVCSDLLMRLALTDKKMPSPCGEIFRGARSARRSRGKSGVRCFHSKKRAK